MNRRYIFLCVRNSENDIESIATGGIDIFVAFMRVAGTATYDSVVYKCWRTINDQSTAASGITYTVRLATP